MKRPASAPIICSFFTSAYEADAREMERTARDFDLETDVRPVPDLGKWVFNCGMKPAFIRDRMEDHPGHPIVWLDADARVRRDPVMFSDLAGVDFAAHWRHGSELLSGTMYFGPTPWARRLAEAWAEAQTRQPGMWDQQVLQAVIESREFFGLIVAKLPAEYTRIFDDPKMGDAVIEHTQASRRLKK